MTDAEEYSPFQGYNQQNTGKQQTTSYKKYPINKYFPFQNSSDVKYQLFSENYPSQKLKNISNAYLSNQNNKSIFGNQIVQQSFTSSDKIRKQIRKQSNHISKQIKQCEKNKKRSSKSTQLKQKKSVQQQIYQQQIVEQLQTYKRLCITLRKQNEQLQQSVKKQQKTQNTFCSEVNQLKLKIKKMYDYCIEKNKSEKNVDSKFKILFQNHSKNLRKLGNILSSNDSCKPIKKKQSKNNIEKINKSYKVSNKQTIDSVRTLNGQSKSSLLKNQKKHCKRRQKSASIQCFDPRKSYSLNIMQKRKKNIQYDMSESEVEQKLLNEQQQQKLNLTSSDQQYRQFFTTFIKSLNIFTNQKQNQSKSKSKLLKQRGNYIQWAKQQWLSIVEYLIKKGYQSEKHKPKGTNSLKPENLNLYSRNKNNSFR